MCVCIKRCISRQKMQSLKNDSLHIRVSLNTTVYVFVSMCLCVCVCVKQTWHSVNLCLALQIELD